MPSFTPAAKAASDFGQRTARLEAAPFQSANSNGTFSPVRLSLTLSAEAGRLGETLFLRSGLISAV
jgi:hypothetical protein